MNKKVPFIIICLFFYSCGFQPMLKNYDLSKINIEKINFSGKNELTYLLKNYLNIETKNNSNSVVMNIFVSESSNPTSKNTSGLTVEEEITIVVKFDVIDKEKNYLLRDEVSGSKRLSVTNNLSSDEETKKIERNNIIKAIVPKIRFKLQFIFQ